MSCSVFRQRRCGEGTPNSSNSYGLYGRQEESLCDVSSISPEQEEELANCTLDLIPYFIIFYFYFYVFIF
jgi:hypothetical protein